MGASNWMILRRVTLPLLKPTILVASLFSFLISFDEVGGLLFYRARAATDAASQDVQQHPLGNLAGARSDLSAADGALARYLLGRGFPAERVAQLDEEMLRFAGVASTTVAVVALIRGRPYRSKGGVPDAAWSERLWQDHPSECDRRNCRANIRAALDLAGGTLRTSLQPAEAGDGFPELCFVPAYDDLRECGVSAAGPEAFLERRSNAAVAEALDPRAAAGCRGPQATRALRRASSNGSLSLGVSFTTLTSFLMDEPLGASTRSSETRCSSRSSGFTAILV